MIHRAKNKTGLRRLLAAVLLTRARRNRHRSH
jgi:hypothetical protein